MHQNKASYVWVGYVEANTTESNSSLLFALPKEGARLVCKLNNTEKTKA